MEIVDVAVKKATVHFRAPFKIAYEQVEQEKIVIIKITDRQGRCGLGSLSVDKEISQSTGETLEKAYGLLRRKLTPLFFNTPLAYYQKYHQKIQVGFAGFTATQAAVEEAAFNLLARQRTAPLADLWGKIQRRRCPIMFTIGIKNLPAITKETKKIIRDGFKIIKLKCGLDLERDVEKIKAINRLLPSKTKLTLDANQGYSLDDAAKLLTAIKKLNLKIALLEQPINKKNIAGLKKLTARKIVPIIADEAVVSLTDASRLLRGNYVDGVNVKLLKCGGPLNFIEIYKLCRRLKKIIMLGCMYESNISITTGANLALSLNIDYVDLDSGRLDFADDPAVGGAMVKNGAISLGKPLKLNFNQAQF